MTQEQGPKSETRFPPDVTRIINWMVFNYDEGKIGNLNKQIAEGCGLNTESVEKRVRELENLGKCDRTQAFTMVVKTATANGALEGMGRISETPLPDLNRREALLKDKFVKGSSNHAIMTALSISLDEFNMLRNRLFKKYNTKSRFFIVAHDAFQGSRK